MNFWIWRVLCLSTISSHLAFARQERLVFPVRNKPPGFNETRIEIAIKIILDREEITSFRSKTFDRIQFWRVEASQTEAARIRRLPHVRKILSRETFSREALVTDHCKGKFRLVQRRDGGAGVYSIQHFC